MLSCGVAGAIVCGIVSEASPQTIVEAAPSNCSILLNEAAARQNNKSS